MFNITDHRGKTTQSHSEISSQLLDGCYRKDKTVSVGEDVGRGKLCPTGGTVNAGINENSLRKTDSTQQPHFRLYVQRK